MTSLLLEILVLELQHDTRFGGYKAIGPLSPRDGILVAQQKLLTCSTSTELGDFLIASERRYARRRPSIIRPASKQRCSFSFNRERCLLNHHGPHFK